MAWHPPVRLGLSKPAWRELARGTDLNIAGSVRLWRGYWALTWPPASIGWENSLAAALREPFASGNFGQ
jgi:hypothetical protein